MISAPNSGKRVCNSSFKFPSEGFGKCSSNTFRERSPRKKLSKAKPLSCFVGLIKSELRKAMRKRVIGLFEEFGRRWEALIHSRFSPVHPYCWSVGWSPGLASKRLVSYQLRPVVSEPIVCQLCPRSVEA